MMTEVGAFLSSEEHRPKDLVQQGSWAEAAGFRSVLISDHFHPWIDAQGQSPFVWSVVGALAASTSLGIMTGVTCPTTRVHPVILAQAAATSQDLLGGRFVFGVGTGEALNEHILGDRWPPVATRLEMLEEAVDVIRQLWSGGIVTHHGRFYTVENARIYTLPDSPPPIVVSAFGPSAAEVAARIGDGLVSVQPDADLLERYRESGGRGPAIAAMKICWDRDESRARKIAHQLWPTAALEGQLSQELPQPALFESATAHVTEEMVADAISCGPDPDRHVAAISRYFEAGCERVYVNQVGPEQRGFFDFFAREIRPRLDL